MKIKEKNKLIPKLRFPEFKDSGEWNTDALGLLAEIKGRIGYRGYTRADIVEKGKGAITLSPTNFDENGKLNFENSTYISWEKYEESPEIMLEEGNTVLVKTASVGKCAYVENLPEKTTINPQIVVLKPRKIYPKFLAYSIFHTYVQNQIKKYIGAGAIPNMSQASIAKINILLPFPQEQQKIASFLSNLDELIEAYKKKLELLKQHKKGLMQNLFPQEGEKVPKLRFPEFRDSGEWVEKEVYKVFDVFAGGDVPKKALSNKKTKEYNIPILSNGIAEKSLYGWTNKAKIYEPSLTVSARGTIGWTSLQKNPFFPVVRLLVLTPKIKINLLYAYYYMKTIENDYKYAKVGIPQLTKPMIKNTKLLIPNNQHEQQKIASCLSSIDEIITAEAKKIEQLEKHKKGLMQGLFPEIN